MAYHVVDLDEIDPNPAFESDRRSIGTVVDLDHVGLSRYRAAPGEQIPKRYHYHDVQEELFYVVRGELHVETPEREFVAGQDAVFVAEPNSPHRAFNPVSADEDLVVIAVGAPAVEDGHFYTPGDEIGAGDGTSADDGDGTSADDGDGTSADDPVR